MRDRPDFYTSVVTGVFMNDDNAGSTTNISGLPSVHARFFQAEVEVPAFTIIYHSNLERIGERALLSGLEMGRELRLSRNEPLFLPIEGGRPKGLEDEALSRKPILINKAGNQIHFDPSKSRTLLAVSGDVVTHQTAFEASDDGLVLELSGRVVLLLHRCPADKGESLPDLGMVGHSQALDRVRAKIMRVADLETPVLLRGESGTGKELVARAIHGSSLRKDRPLIAINMGGIQPELAAAELFGAEKGAYTGAVKSRMGYFREADGGTLFLDEIGEAPPNIQTLLLRVLETREVQPVGSGKVIPVDVRIIAATDANLEAMVDQGAFRSPVIHRLSSYEIRLPPLRERRDDIGRLLRYLLKKELGLINALPYLDPGRKHPWFPAPLAALLTRYSWPGNVRQLGNVLRQLVISNRGCSRFEVDRDINAILQADLAGEHKKHEPKRRGPIKIDDQLLEATLEAHQWELTPAARALNISRPTLYKLVAACQNLRLAQDLTANEIAAGFEKHQGRLDAMVRAFRVSGYALRRRLKDMGLDPIEEEAGA